MIEQLFFIKKMPESRIADYYLGYMGGCLFFDFNNYDNDRITLKRISFDGFGCCELDDRAIPMDKEDSRNFKILFKDNLKDQKMLLTIVKKAITLNKHAIWADALEGYNLN